MTADDLHAKRASRTIGLALAMGAALGPVYALVTDAGHLSLGYVFWGAIFAVVLARVVGAARAIHRAPRR
jgi:hypothetical protein